MGFQEIRNNVRTQDNVDFARKVRSFLEGIVADKIRERNLTLDEKLYNNIETLGMENVINSATKNRLHELRLIGNAGTHSNATPDEKSVEKFNEVRSNYEIYEKLISTLNELGYNYQLELEEQLPFTIGSTVYGCEKRISTRIYKAYSKTVSEGIIEKRENCIIVEAENERGRTVCGLLSENQMESRILPPTFCNQTDYKRIVLTKDTQKPVETKIRYSKWIYVYPEKITLREYFTQNGENMTIEQKVSIINSLFEISQALDAVSCDGHTYNIAHRNINPDTIFYDGQNLKLGFFHWAKIQQNAGAKNLNTTMKNFLDDHMGGRVNFNTANKDFMHPALKFHIENRSGQSYTFDESKKADIYSIVSVFCYLFGFSFKDRDFTNRVRQLRRSRGFNPNFLDMVKEIGSGRDTKYYNDIRTTPITAT